MDDSLIFKQKLTYKARLREHISSHPYSRRFASCDFLICSNPAKSATKLKIWFWKFFFEHSYQIWFFSVFVAYVREIRAWRGFIECYNLSGATFSFFPYRRKLDWLELRGRRTYLAAVLMYKNINISQPASLAPLFRKCQSRKSSRNGRELMVPPSRMDFGLKSFWSQGTRLWNSLPRDIRYLPSASRFKSAMRRYLLERSSDADCILM